CVYTTSPLWFSSDASALGDKPVTYTCSALPCALKADALAAVTSQTANAKSVVMTLIRARRRSADRGTERRSFPAWLTRQSPPARFARSNSLPLPHARICKNSVSRPGSSLGPDVGPLGCASIYPDTPVVARIEDYVTRPPGFFVE